MQFLPRFTSFAVAAALFCAVCGMLWMSGAFDAEFSGAPDEAAHYVTSQMVRDYLISGGKQEPMDYAVRYYARYPKVAFGIWPPLYHVMLGVWMIMGHGRESAMIFMALIAALTGFVLFQEMRRIAGFALAALLASWFICLPVVQMWTGTTMLDMPLTLLALLATVCFGRYLETGDWKWSAGFGLFSACAILTKYNGLALAFVPMLTIVLRRRFDLLRRRDFWLSAGIVVGLCGPWYLMQSDLVSYAMDPKPTLAVSLPSAWGNLTLAVKLTGLLFPMALIGWFLERRKRDGDVPAALVSMAAAWWAFHSFLYPVVEPRYMLPLIPAIVFLAAKGFQISMRTFRSQWKPAFTLALVFAVVGFEFPSRVATGVEDAAERVLAHSQTMLIASDSEGEGGFVAAVAERDTHKKHVVLRASKVLATTTWMAANYKVRHHSAGAILNFLDDSTVDAVVLDNRNVPFFPHHYALQDAVAGDPRWKLDACIDAAPKVPGCMAVFRRRQALPPGPAREVEVDLTYTLNKVLKVSP